MYEILKAVIIAGNVSVSILTHKVDMAWADGKITDEQKLELEKLIFEYKNPEAEAPELAKLYKRLESKVTELEAKQADLESRLIILEDGDVPAEPPTTVPAREPWDGITDQYQYGAAVTHGEKYWLDVLKDMQNTWEPGVVDERYWKEISKEDAEAIVAGKKTPEEVLNPETEDKEEG